MKSGSRSSHGVRSFNIALNRLGTARLAAQNIHKIMLQGNQYLGKLLRFQWQFIYQPENCILDVTMPRLHKAHGVRSQHCSLREPLHNSDLTVVWEAIDTVRVLKKHLFQLKIVFLVRKTAQQIVWIHPIKDAQELCRGSLSIWQLTVGGHPILRLSTSVATGAAANGLTPKQATCHPTL